MNYIPNSYEKAQHYKYIDGFVFCSINLPLLVFDAIVIRNPITADCWCPQIGFSTHTLQEHIEYINDQKIEKALIIADKIDFLQNCPTLKKIQLIPSDNIKMQLDFSPLYSMTSLEMLNACTYSGPNKVAAGIIEYDRIYGLKELYITDTKQDRNFHLLPRLEKLVVQQLRNSEDLTKCFTSERLKILDILSGKIRSLNGLGKSKDLKILSLSYCRTLSNIDGLKEVADTLQCLQIDSCPRITDFSCLDYLVNLRELWLLGNNTLPNLHFLEKMPNLKRLIISCNIADGDLSLCKQIPYVYVYPDRRHYNLKDKDLSKALDILPMY